MRTVFALLFLALLAAAQDGTVTDSAFDNLAQACEAANASGRALVVTRVWHNQPAFRCAASVTVLKGGMIQPAAGQKIVLAGSLEAGVFRVFDLSAGEGAAVMGFRAQRYLVQWWGAAGDGRGDDTPAINQAIEAAEALQMPAVVAFGIGGSEGSRYRTRDTIRIAASDSLTLEGPAQIDYLGTGMAISVKKTPAALTHGLAIRNLRVLANARAGTQTGIYVDSCYSCILDHLYVENTAPVQTGYGIQIDGAGHFAAGIVVSDTRVNQWKYGIGITRGTDGSHVALNVTLQNMMIDGKTSIIPGSRGVTLDGAQNTLMTGSVVEAYETGVYLSRGEVGFHSLANHLESISKANFDSDGSNRADMVIGNHYDSPERMGNLDNFMIFDSIPGRAGRNRELTIADGVDGHGVALNLAGNTGVKAGAPGEINFYNGRNRIAAIRARTSDAKSGGLEVSTVAGGAEQMALSLEPTGDATFRNRVALGHLAGVESGTQLVGSKGSTVRCAANFRCTDLAGTLDVTQASGSVQVTIRFGRMWQTPPSCLATSRLGEPLWLEAETSVATLQTPAIRPGTTYRIAYQCVE